MYTPSKSRKRPAPSPRDQQIYLDYQVSGKRQTDLAAQYELTQCRISQIIRRVAAWRSQADAREEGEPAPRQQQQLDRFLERERLNFIARESLRLFGEEQKTITKKSGTRGDNAIDETTERTAPPNVQYLKIALQATRQLSQLEEKAPLPLTELDSDERERIMRQELFRIREEAEAAGKVSKSVDVWGAVKRILNALVGEPNDAKRSSTLR